MPIVLKGVQRIENPLKAIEYGIPAVALSQCCNKGGVGSKNDRRVGTNFFEPEGYKIEPLLIKMVNKANDDI